MPLLKLTAKPYAEAISEGAARTARARLRARVVQTLILLVIGALLYGAIAAVWSGLKQHGIGFSFHFLSQPAGFTLSEGWTLAREHAGNLPHLMRFADVDTNAQGLLAGLINTLRVTAVALVIATGLGTCIGVSRLSSNWLTRQWASAFVELLRNTPVLIQIIFWYFAVVVQLPSASEANPFHGWLIFSRQGLFVPSLIATGANLQWIGIVASALLGGTCAIRSESPRTRVIAAVVTVLAIALLATFTRASFMLDLPQPTKFSVSGGMGLTPEFTALLIAISLNSAAYIAEIVRGAIESVDRGQWEAAEAIGLAPLETLRVVILPQAMPVILPSLANQYISLAKNSSFGIAIGFPDLFNVYGTVANQSGRSLEAILVIMLAYVGVSAFISSCLTFFSRRTSQKRGR